MKPEIESLNPEIFTQPLNVQEGGHIHGLIFKLTNSLS